MTQLDDPKAALAELDARINALLPPRYQHCYADTPSTSMGSASMKYGVDGRVAWDRIWTSFCDLAIAGGPPHRGSLLEAVDPQSVAADPNAYAEVVAELVRALKLVSGLPVEPGEPGWVRVDCASNEMAAWLRAAVVAENVIALRTGCDLLLPAGPQFYVEKQIKNVVVALAKTLHYWDGHLSSTQHAAAASLLEPIAPTDGDPTALLENLRPNCDWPLDAERYVGWVGVQTNSVEATVWLLRAILIEGILVRREEEWLYLPTGGTASDAAKVADRFAHARHLWQYVGQ